MKKDQTKKTQEEWLEEVQKNGMALLQVPIEFRTQELCAAALHANRLALPFQWVPEKYRTAELCTVAVKKNGNMLKCVLAALQTTELCNAAVEQTGWALKYVPKGLSTAELCAAAVKQRSGALQYVPETRRCSRCHYGI